MYFQPQLTTARLVQRYKRFLADVKFDDGRIITVHCPNTGSMRRCSQPGSRVAISRSPNPGRKYPHTLEMVEDGGVWVGVNTARTNGLVAQAIEDGVIGEFDHVQSIRREVKVSAASRLDLQVRHGGGETAIEVKSCSLAEERCAMFPDAVTARGTRHLEELMALKAAGLQSCIFFLVQRMDADHFTPADHIDPVYGETLRKAAAAGVQVLVYQAAVSPEAIEIVGSLPCRL